MNKIKRIPWLAILFGFLALSAWLAGKMQSNVSDISSSQSVPPPSIGRLASPGDSVAYETPKRVGIDNVSLPYWNNVPSNDTRELLKKSYNATLKTRHVVDLTQQVETTVRGHRGRVDESQSSDQYGYVSFVVPESEYDTFRQEIRSLVGERYISEQVSSKNLLPQKISIENQRRSVQANIDTLKALAATQLSEHNATVRSIQQKISSGQAELSSLQAQLVTTTDPNTVQSISQRINEIARDISYQQSRLTNENASYKSKTASLNEQLAYASSTLGAANTSDQNLMDDVATVNGTISLRWISVWEIIRLLTGSWIPAIFALVCIFLFLWERQLWIFKPRTPAP